MEREPIPISNVPIRLSWGAIFGGTFVAAGIWILLYALGLAVGLSRLDFDTGRALRAAGIGPGIWSFIAPVLALFVGGLVTARCAGFVDRASGAIHGAVMWGLTMLAGTILISITLSSLVGAMVGVAGLMPREHMEAGRGIVWGMFLSLLFGLAAAVLGATAGVSRKQRLRPSATTLPPTEPALR
jgi:hypothetical protein